MPWRSCMSLFLSVVICLLVLIYIAFLTLYWDAFPFVHIRHAKIWGRGMVIHLHGYPILSSLLLRLVRIPFSLIIIGPLILYEQIIRNRQYLLSLDPWEIRQSFSWTVVFHTNVRLLLWNITYSKSLSGLEKTNDITWRYHQQSKLNSAV